MGCYFNHANGVITPSPHPHDRSECCIFGCFSISPTLSLEEEGVPGQPLWPASRGGSLLGEKICNAPEQLAYGCIEGGDRPTGRAMESCWKHAFQGLDRFLFVIFVFFVV